MRPKDQEMTTIEKIVCYSDPKRRGHTTPRRATQRRTGADQEAEGVRGKCGQKPSCGFHGKQKARQGKQV